MLSSFLLVAWALVPLAPNSLEGALPVHTTVSAELIVKLGSRDYRERESATKSLNALGGMALPELRKAAHDKDPEVRRRAETLVEVIERREETARLLAPRLVHLKVKNDFLYRAVFDLAQQSGFSVSIDEAAQDAIRNQRINLDTGQTTFWQALDALTSKAALVDNPLPDREMRRLARNSTGPNLHIVRNVQRQAMYPVSAHDGATQLYLHSLDQTRDLASAKEPVCYAGALRLRVGHPARIANGEILLPIEVSPQPNVLWEQLVDIHVDKAIDEGGQDLMQALQIAEPNSVQINKLVMGLGNGMVLNAAGGLDRISDQGGIVRLESGGRPSRKLDTLSGTIIGHMRTPVQTMVSVENVRQQAGKTFRTSFGESLEVSEVKEQADGSVKLRVRLKEPPTMLVMPGNGRIAARGNIVLGGQQVIFNRLGARTDGRLHVDLIVKDSRGHTLPVEPTFQNSITFANNMIATDVVMVVKPAKGEAALHKLEWTGQHTVSVEVPFVFKNIQLP